MNTRVILAAAFVLAAFPAMAEDQVLAVSKSHRLQVLAEGGAAWCNPTVRLRMVLEADSPDLGNSSAQAQMMSRLKTPIVTDCKVANGAEVTVFEGGKVSGTFKGGDASGWVFAPVIASAPVTVAPVVAPAPVAPVPAVPSAAVVSAPPAPVVAPPVPPQAAPPVSPTVVPQPEASQIDYFDTLARWLHDNPALAQDESTIRLWAAHRFGREYSSVQNQEFKVQPVLQKARVDFAQFLEKPRGDVVLIVSRAFFGAYDFEKRRFPIKDLGNQMSYTMPCCQSVKVPSSFVVKLQEQDAIRGLPMEASEAQAFAERRTRYGSVNRTIYLALSVRLDKAGFKSDGWGGPTTLGTVEAVTFYPDDDLTQPILTVSAADFAKWREARVLEREEVARQVAEREAEVRRQRLMAQRENFIGAMAKASSSVRLANFISDGDINLYRRLDNVRAARSAALLSGKAVPVSLLVQSDGSGRSGVVTSWPGKLELNLPETLPAMTSSQWYLVRGLLSVPETEGVGNAQVAVLAAHACTQAKCVDATDPAAVIDHKLAGVP